MGSHDEAVGCYRNALDIYRTVGADRYDVALVLRHLGDAHSAAGDDASSRAAWSEALAILEDLGHDDAAEVRTKLTAEHAKPD